MQTESTAVVNTAYFDNITAQVNAIQGVDVCVGVQEILDEAAVAVQAQLDAIRKEISALLPLSGSPGSLGAVISWIKSMASQYAAAIAAYEAEITQTLAAVGRLEAAIASLSKRLVTCNLSLPSIS
jgi:CelD/BcsL family acetyltransferase involved in cellulose biosynthesis